MNGTQMKKKIYEKIQEKTKDADGYFERVNKNILNFICDVSRCRVISITIKNYFHTKQIYRPKLHFF